MNASESFCRRPAGDGVTAMAPGLRGRLRAARRSASARSRLVEQRVASITTVLLDMGGVVIPSLFESTAVPGFPAGPLGADDAWRAVERGSLPERDYWAEVARAHPEVDLGVLWRACSYVRDDIRTLVGIVAPRVKVVAFTNDMSYWFGDDWEDRFSTLTLFDGVLEGSRLGASKPHPEAFLLAAQAVGELPARCLFVDDLEVNCEAARSVGMQTLLYDVRDREAAGRALLGALGLDAVPH